MTLTHNQLVALLERCVPYLPFELRDEVYDARRSLRSPDADGVTLMPNEPTEEILAAANVASLSIETLLDDTRFACERAYHKAAITVAREGK